MRPPSPMSIRICSAKAPTRERASTRSTRSRGPRRTRARELPVQPRSVRRDLRSGGARHRHRAVRRVPVSLRGRRGAATPVGARRLAAPPLDLRRRRGRGPPNTDPARRTLEDARQSPTHSLGAGRLAHPGRRLDRARTLGPGVDGVRARHPGSPGADPRRLEARSPRARDLQAHASSRRRGELALAGAQIALGVTLLAHQAWLMGDAIVRTLLRCMSLADGCSSGSPPRSPSAARPGGGRGVPPDGRRAGAGPGRRGAGRVHRSLPPGCWPRPSCCCGPCRRCGPWVSQPPPASRAPALSPQEVATRSGSTARRTWRFFETFVGPDDNFLPPDNFQEDPKPVVAHRTSPTNIGLYLLATLAARDLGWIGSPGCSRPAGGHPRDAARLERFRGHFYNWYDTRRSSAPGASVRLHGRQREPRRSSPGARPRLSERGRSPAAGSRSSHGHSTMRCASFRSAAGALSSDRRSQTVTLAELRGAAETLAAALDESPVSPMDWAARLRHLSAPGATRSSTWRAP